MLTIPAFEHSVLVTDDPILAARVSALFTYPKRYLPVLDGPRMSRPDADNEVTRRRNAMVLTGARQVLMGGLPLAAIEGVRPGWKTCTVSDSYAEHVRALRGFVKQSRGALRWGPDNLGIGIYEARLARLELQPDLEVSPATSVVDAGQHLLVACERGDSMAEVVASNLAFACGASFMVFPELDEAVREAWIEEIYALGEGGDVTGQFDQLKHRARAHLGEFHFEKYKTVLFVTAGFPWGVSVPQVATTHMYRYPDFGRAVVEGLWASQTASRSARTALLIDPQTVEGSEIQAINKALIANGTLTRVVRGSAATQTRVQYLMSLLPYDVIVLSTHSGDAPGERITYEYPDKEGRQRCLVVDRVLGIGHDVIDGQFMVTEYRRFHSLDGVAWHDKAGKDALPVGTALTTWIAMDGLDERNDYITNQQPVPRVPGSMAILMHDGIWLYAPQSFGPGAMPFFVNNSCWSWHEQSQRTIFAGARGYLGSLFPITNTEAQDVCKALFGRYLGCELPQALWKVQREIYGSSVRRPYVLVGLPFITIRPNISDAVSFMAHSYAEGISCCDKHRLTAPHEEHRQDALRSLKFLLSDLHEFRLKHKLGHNYFR